MLNVFHRRFVQRSITFPISWRYLVLGDSHNPFSKCLFSYSQDLVWLCCIQLVLREEMDLGYKSKQPRGDSPDLTPLSMLRETKRTLSLGMGRLTTC